MQNHKCNEVENAFPIFKVSRLVMVHKWLVGGVPLNVNFVHKVN